MINKIEYLMVEIFFFDISDQQYVFTHLPITILPRY